MNVQNKKTFSLEESTKKKDAKGLLTKKKASENGYQHRYNFKTWLFSSLIDEKYSKFLSKKGLKNGKKLRTRDLAKLFKKNFRNLFFKNFARSLVFNANF